MLPVFSVETEEEAQRLLVRTCPTNNAGQYIAPDLAKEQTIENLMAFGDRLRASYERMEMSDTPPKSDKPQSEPVPADVAKLWSEHAAAWGPPSDHNVTDRQELDGYHLGEEVRLTDDGPDGGYEGDEGVIVGISHTGAGLFSNQAKDELVVWFEEAGYDTPLGVSPEIVEPI